MEQGVVHLAISGLSSFCTTHPSRSSSRADTPSCLTECGMAAIQDWFGHCVLEASCGPGSGLEAGEESWPFCFPASGRWGENNGSSSLGA